MSVQESELYEIVITVTRILVQRSLHFSRMCDAAWRYRLRNLSRKDLLKKLQFLINHLDLRTIKKCFNRGLFSDLDILRITYNEIVRRGVQNTFYVEPIIKVYKLCGK